MTEPAEVIEHGSYTIEIHYDEDPLNPRTEWDHESTMVCFHRRHDLGDKHDYRSEDYNGWTEFAAQLKRDGARIILPLYLLDHSGISISTGDFNDPWDSGQIGFIFQTGPQIREQFCVKRITKETQAKALECLAAEVKEYDQYLTGDVYGYIIKNSDDEEVDSCWGFFGQEYCIEEAKSVASCLPPCLVQEVL